MKAAHRTPALERRFIESTGYGTLGHLAAQLLDHAELEGFDPDRIIEALEMAPEHFWDAYVGPMMDRIANDLARGFHKSDWEWEFGE